MTKKHNHEQKDKKVEHSPLIANRDQEKELSPKRKVELALIAIGASTPRRAKKVKQGKTTKAAGASSVGPKITVSKNKRYKYSDRYVVKIERDGRPPEIRHVSAKEAEEWRKFQTDEYPETTSTGPEASPKEFTRPLHDRVLFSRIDENGIQKSDTGDKSLEALDDKEKKEHHLLDEVVKITPYTRDRKVEIIEPPHKWVAIDEELTDFEKRIVWKLRLTELSKADETAIERSIADIIHAVMKDNGQRLVLIKAPMLWKERDKSLGQQPHEFIQTTYFDADHKVDRATLRKLDRTLLLSLERQERDPEKAPPQDFLDRLPRKRDTVNAEVAHVKETGQRPTSYAERMRLEQAARRRGTTLGKE